MIGARPTVTQVTLADSGTEYSTTLPTGTSRVTIKLAAIGATLRISYESGGTGGSTNEYVTLAPGAVYDEVDAKLSGVTIYLKASSNSQTAEVKSWVS